MQAKVDRYIVNRLKAALHQLKQCRSAAECVDYGVVLGAVAPTREDGRSHDGMLRSVFKRLGVQRGSRYVKKTGESRPRAPDKAVTRRAAFDSEVLRRPLQVDDAAMSQFLRILFGST